MSLLKRPFGIPVSQHSAVLSTIDTAALKASAPGRAASRLVRAAGAQRIRVGLTGLAAIFLLVMMAAAGVKPAESAAPVAAQGEPLAVLGVAPGAGPAATERHDQAAPARRPSRH